MTIFFLVQFLIHCRTLQILYFGHETNLLFPLIWEHVGLVICSLRPMHCSGSDMRHSVTSPGGIDKLPLRQTLRINGQPKYIRNEMRRSIQVLAAGKKVKIFRSAPLLSTMRQFLFHAFFCGRFAAAKKCFAAQSRLFLAFFAAAKKNDLKTGMARAEPANRYKQTRAWTIQKPPRTKTLTRHYMPQPRTPIRPAEDAPRPARQ